MGSVFGAPFTAMQVCVVLAALAAGAWVALRPARGGGRTTATSVLGGGMAAVLVTCASIFALVLFGVGAFGVIRLLYLAGVVTIPLIAVAVLAARFRGAAVTRAATALAAAGLLLAPFGVYVPCVAPYELRVEEATVPLAAGRAGREPLRIGVLADLQCDEVTDYERRVVDTLLAQRPDLILVPGDLFQGTADEWAAARDDLLALLRRLDAPHGVYFVVGDVDHDRTVDLLRETTIRVLRDEVVRVRAGDRTLTIGGVSWRDEDVVRALETAPGDDDVRLLLCHRPDHVLRLREGTRVDLVVAGHTHGGQVVVPGFGPPLTLSQVPRHVAAGGLHDLGGRRIYVSRGAGMERLQAPHMRLFCPPEVTVLRF